MFIIFLRESQMRDIQRIPPPTPKNPTSSPTSKERNKKNLRKTFIPPAPK